MDTKTVIDHVARILQDNMGNRLTMSQINGILYDLDQTLRQIEAETTTQKIGD